VIRKAVARLPQNQRERFEEEWQSHIDEVPGEIGKIYVALGCLFAARKMASILSADRERTVLAEVVTRAFDLALAVGFLFLVSPLLVLMALSVWLEGTGPVLVAEDIVGMHGRIFRGYTFATSGRVGKMLDRTYLSVLPGILSVLRGDMAIIGPMPHVSWVAERLSKVVPGYEERTKIKPGFLCLAALTKRPIDPLTELRLDLAYIENRSLGSDLLILGRHLRCPLSKLLKMVEKL
jgi:lipopolysaccharide/colanic/teichoic acid biosynthesis glycosyltransferase